MKESIRFDIQGTIHLDFGDDELIHCRQDLSIPDATAQLAGRTILTNRPLRYDRISWIGCVRQRQWYLLVMGIPGVLMGMAMCMAFIEKFHWGGLFASIAFLLLIGLWPLWLCYHGRPYLVIASDVEIIAFPMDRQKGKIRRILGLLSRLARNPLVRWELDGTPFADRDKWDSRPREHKPHNAVRTVLISTLLMAVGAVTLLRHPELST